MGLVFVVDIDTSVIDLCGSFTRKAFQITVMYVQALEACIQKRRHRWTGWAPPCRKKILIFPIETAKIPAIAPPRALKLL